MSKTGSLQIQVKKGLRKSWTASTCTIEGDTFTAKTAKGAVFLEIDRRDAKVTKGSVSKGKYQFTVTTSDGKNVMAAASEEECVSWISAFSRSVSIDDFELGTVVGRGGFGKVQVAIHKVTGVPHALKKFSKIQLAREEVLDRVIYEKDVLLQMKHPFLVRANYAFQSDANLFIAMEFVQGGELFGRIKERRRLDISEMRVYIAQISMAVGYMHGMGLVHRDLKPENILFDRNGYVKVTDFGLVKGNMKDATTQTFCGTPDYIAPEMIQGVPYGKDVDWWSVGCLAYEMVCGIPPFFSEDTNEIYRAVLKQPVSFPRNVTLPNDAIDFIESLLSKDPKMRLGSGSDLDDIKDHPFMEGVAWQAMFDGKIEMPWKPVLSDMIDPSQFDEVFTAEDIDMTYEDASSITASVQREFTGFSMVQHSVIH